MYRQGKLDFSSESQSKGRDAHVSLFKHKNQIAGSFSENKREESMICHDIKEKE